MTELPELGYGIALGSQLMAEVMSTRRAVDWFEILSENFIDGDGWAREALSIIAERYPVALHGVAMSIGSCDPIDFDYLRRLKGLAYETGAAWVGDYLAWTSAGGRSAQTLLPLPYNSETLAHVSERVRVVQDVLERPLMLACPTSHMSFASNTMAEGEFRRHLAEATDSGIILDVASLWASCRNHDLDAIDYLDHIPGERVVAIRLSGCVDLGGHCVAVRNDCVDEQVWELYAEVRRRVGARSTVVQWDQQPPGLEVVCAEVMKARDLDLEPEPAGG